MTPKEKALKLCQSFGMTTLFAQDCNGGVTLPLSIAKKCAIIAVDEILSLKVENDCKEWKDNQHYWYSAEYWIQVKLEIEKL